MDLSQDELEYLWSIARRSTLALKLPDASLARLTGEGLLVVNHGWPSLTGKARTVLSEQEAQMLVLSNAVRPK